MPFERIVMTDSKTLLLGGLLAIDLKKLGSAGLRWEAEEMRIEDEVADIEKNQHWRGISFHVRDAELRLRDRADRQRGAVLRLRAFQRMKDPLVDQSFIWKLGFLRLNEYSYQRNIERQWYTGIQTSNNQNVELFARAHSGGFADKTGRWYHPRPMDQDLFAAA